MMSRQDEYRQYEGECLESARTATSDELCKHFLELSKLWMTAAQKLDEGFEVRASFSGQNKSLAI
jgi:hypothetical protein